MNLLLNIYDVFGNYLFIIGIPMLCELISCFYRFVKYKKKPTVFSEKCKLLLQLVYVCVFVLGYLLFILFMADTQSRATFIRQSGTIISTASVIGVLGYIAYKKYNKQVENQNNSSKNYTIKSDSFLLWIFIIGSAVCGVFEIFCILEKAELWVHSISLAFLLTEILGVLNIGLWKIEVNDMEITYRSTFGRVRKYNFKDITKGVYKKSGAFRVYIGEQRIFTFDDNMEFSLFIAQMNRLHIPVWSYNFSVKMKRKSR